MKERFALALISVLVSVRISTFKNFSSKNHSLLYQWLFLDLIDVVEMGLVRDPTTWICKHSLICRCAAFGCDDHYFNVPTLESDTFSFVNKEFHLPLLMKELIFKLARIKVIVNLVLRGLGSNLFSYTKRKAAWWEGGYFKKIRE
jgi:hypothetical protein